jgi:hypothetical protein
MSESFNTRKRNIIHRQLLATASAVALLGIGTVEARADDHPLVWIEANGQFAQSENGEDAFAPPFLSASPFDAISHLGLEKGPHTVWNEGAKLSFLPPDSDWVFSASIQYGKNGQHAVREGHPTTAHFTKYNGRYSAYQKFDTQNTEQHMILDFQAGKDFGLGMFGREGSSVFSLGVRFAQFNSKGNTQIRSQPTNVNSSYAFHRFQALIDTKRKFSGVGPSLSWDASANLIGNPSAGNITLDWGLNGALLFGRQSVQGYRQVTNYYHYCTDGCFNQTVAYRHTAPLNRRHEVVVPDLGGFAGLSWRYPIAKVSIGYRADMFFGAVDGGIDSVHREARGFYGPFASVSVGLGGP